MPAKSRSRFSLSIPGLKFAIICVSRLLGLLALGALTNAHGQLILTNYSASHPIKIMCIGDSITDDCEVNGAWRAELQYLLTNNSYAFNFVGRQASGVSGVFTQTHHEGYCGAVVATPGVYPAHQYAAAQNYLQNIVPGALAVTNNRPDVVLILIAANDIGQGRDPNEVASTDLPVVINMVFSNVPNASVILAKITSLQSATLQSYGAYAGNVPIYNAYLQTMVNQRRALGQHISLADMFSVVDYNTMFMADHVHPNTTGLIAVANEWLTRIKAITVGSNTVTTPLIHGGDAWTYSDNGQDFGTNWAQPGFDDSAWSNGVGRFGYGDATVATTVNYGPNPSNEFVTTYFRHSFVVPTNAGITNLNLRLAQTAGAVVWLNGQQIYSTNLPAGPISYSTLATNSVTGFNSYIYYRTNVVVPVMSAGTNLLAVEIHQSSVTNPILGFDAEMIGTGYATPPIPQILQPNPVSAAIGTHIVLTNAVSGDPFVPFTFALGAGSPGRLGTNGVYRWTPECINGSTTNRVTIWATDSANPPQSNSMTFAITVSECVEVGLASGVVQTGSNICVPVNMFSTVSVTNLNFTLVDLPMLFTNWDINAGNPAIGRATAQSVDPQHTLFTIGAANGKALLGSNVIGTICLQANANDASAFAQLAPSSIGAIESNLIPLSHFVSQPGQMVVVGLQLAGGNRSGYQCRRCADRLRQSRHQLRHPDDDQSVGSQFLDTDGQRSIRRSVQHHEFHRNQRPAVFPSRSDRALEPV